MNSPQRVAIIGGGYAGMAAAAALASRGIAVSVFEAARTLGGRARRVDKHGLALDNGQHILVGAYVELLRLMHLVGADPAASLMRLPLTLVFPRTSLLAPGFKLKAPHLPAPLHLAAALLTAQGLPLSARVAAIRFMRAMQRCNFRVARDTTLSALLDAHLQPDSVRRYLWNPLCLSALNTPPNAASAQIFLNVLRDTLAAKRAASDLLLPRVDLSALFPEPAADYVRRHGGEVLLGTPILAVLREAAGGREGKGFRLQGDPLERCFDQVIAAVPPFRLAALVATLVSECPELRAATDCVAAFQYEPILTAYLRYPQVVQIPEHMVGIAGGTADFLFTRANERLVVAIISARGPHLALDREVLAARLHAEIQTIAGPLPPPEWTQIITEKRATFACAPKLKRPDSRTALPGFFLAGDYVASDYPATLESAVRSGVACANLVIERTNNRAAD